MIKLITAVLASFFITHNLFAQPVELMCKGEIETQLLNYKGNGKTQFKSLINLEVTFDPSLYVVNRLFSAELRLSLCELDNSARVKCNCKITDNLINCSYNNETLDSSIVQINRKTGIAKVSENFSFINQTDSSTFTVMRNADIECIAYDRNKF